MYFIYIIHSASGDVYYVGYSDNPPRRLFEHNTKPFNNFTSKHRPLILKVAFACSTKEAEAIQIERFIKKLRSRKLIEKLLQSDYTPDGILDQLVRVIDVGDYLSRMSGKV